MSNVNAGWICDPFFCGLNFAISEVFFFICKRLLLADHMILHITSAMEILAYSVHLAFSMEFLPSIKVTDAENLKLVSGAN